jgi:hypothetical protein
MPRSGKLKNLVQPEVSHSASVRWVEISPTFFRVGQSFFKARSYARDTERFHWQSCHPWPRVLSIPLTIIDKASASIFRANTIGPANRRHETAYRRAFFPLIEFASPGVRQCSQSVHLPPSRGPRGPASSRAIGNGHTWLGWDRAVLHPPPVQAQRRSAVSPAGREDRALERGGGVQGDPRSLGCS